MFMPEKVTSIHKGATCVRHPVTFGDLSVELYRRAAAEKGEGRNGQAEVEKRQIGHGCVIGWVLPDTVPEIRPVAHLESDPGWLW